MYTGRTTLRDVCFAASRPLALGFACLVVATSVGLAQQATTSGAADLSTPSRTSSEDASILLGVGFDQKLDNQVPMDRPFLDEQGTPRRLGEYFGERPVVLAMIYYRCPTLCSQVLNGLVRSLRPLSLEAGEDFDVIAVSIDPKDTPPLAARKKATYVEEYGRPGSESSWHFLTGDPADVRALADSIGFRYTYNAASDLYAHAAGIVVLTPEGRVSRYLFGMDFPPRDLQFSILQSSTGKIGNPVRQVLMFCYDYDIATGTYTLSIVRVTQVFGVLTVVALAAAVLLMLRWERRRRGSMAHLEPPVCEVSS